MLPFGSWLVYNRYQGAIYLGFGIIDEYHLDHLDNGFDLPFMIHPTLDTLDLSD